MGLAVVDGRGAMGLGSVVLMRGRINSLVLAGLKKATAGILDDYGDEPREFAREQLTLVNDDLEGVGVVEVTKTELTTFGAVPRSFALAENEGDASIEEWREGIEGFGRATASRSPTRRRSCSSTSGSSARRHDPTGST